jgi:hypothetical protein
VFADGLLAAEFFDESIDDFARGGKVAGVRRGIILSGRGGMEEEETTESESQSRETATGA